MASPIKWDWPRLIRAKSSTPQHTPTTAPLSTRKSHLLSHPHARPDKLDGEYSIPRHAVGTTPRQPRAQRDNSNRADEPKTLLACLPLLSPLGARHHDPSLLASTHTPLRLC